MADEPLILPQDEFELVRKVADRMQQDAATARTLLSGVLVEEISRRIGECENTITWNTTCISCARVMDRAYAETVRREAAEARLAEVRQTVATFLTVRGEDGTADLAEAIRQVLDREQLGGGEEET